MTKYFTHSSRSHLLVMLTVEGRDVSSHAHTKGTLTLVDLAGSERVSKTEASGQRLVEAAAINKSLSSLGQVGTMKVLKVKVSTIVFMLVKLWNMQRSPKMVFLFVVKYSDI